MIELKDFPDRHTLEIFQARFAELDIPSLESWLAILKSAAFLEERLNSFLADHGLQQSRFFTLILLARHRDGLILSALAEKVGVSNPTMTGLIQRMERDGLVQRMPSMKSRRESIIRLSDAGDGLLADALPEHYRRVVHLMHELTADEHVILQKILRKISISIQGDTK